MYPKLVKKDIYHPQKGEVYKTRILEKMSWVSDRDCEQMVDAIDNPHKKGKGIDMCQVNQKRLLHLYHRQILGEATNKFVVIFG
ncbi:MAG: hypothetical protein CM15mL5_2350 [uncultured marine virus]|nr:MAG: hypothetical protein CM15mL5_2350 [uncultured marine virus]